jgi:hypothetical protein
MRDMAPPRSDRAARRHADRRVYSRVLGAAFIISLAVHLAVLFLVSFRLDIESERAPPPRTAVPEQVMRAYNIAPVAATVAPIEQQLLDRERERLLLLPAAPLPWGLTPPGDAAAAPGADPGTAVRDPLRYRMGSREVWRPQAPLPAEELSPDERVRARIATQLEQYNDSVAAEADARARALDWTIKTADGGRWGISPGAIHLGGITLPLPVEFSPPPDKRAEVAGRVRTWSEIQQQAARAETRDIFNERVRAIREKNEQERARQNSVTGTSGGTTGGGGGGGTTGG